MELRTDLIDDRKATTCSNIAELLTYLVNVLGDGLYSKKQELINLINDLSRVEQRIKRFYLRAIKEDGLPERLMTLRNLDISEQHRRIKQIVVQFSDENACSVSHSAEIINAFAEAIGLNAIDASELSQNNMTTRNGKKVVVVDTSVLLKRPAIISELLEKFDEVVIPKVVSGELNYQKDHANPQIKQKAWLVLKNIGLHKSNRISFFESRDSSGINDEKIANIACEKARQHPQDKVYMLAQDVYFSILTKGLKNLTILTLEEYSKEFPETSKFDMEKTRQFISILKKHELKEIRLFKSDSLIDINHIDPETGYTPLIMAIRFKNIEIIRHLLQEFKGFIDLDKHDKFKYNFTPLLHAVQIQHLDIIKLLFEAGADIGIGSSGKNAGNTPLMVCAWHGFYEGAVFFVGQGACCNQQDSNGFTALTKACIKGHFQIAALLVDRTDMGIRSRDNKKVFEYIEQGKSYSEALFNLFKTKL
jgi:rRNA-processing protein FCF1